MKHLSSLPQFQGTTPEAIRFQEEVADLARTEGVKSQDMTADNYMKYVGKAQEQDPPLSPMSYEDWMAGGSPRSGQMSSDKLPPTYGANSEKLQSINKDVLESMARESAPSIDRLCKDGQILATLNSDNPNLAGVATTAIFGNTSIEKAKRCDRQRDTAANLTPDHFDKISVSNLLAMAGRGDWVDKDGTPIAGSRLSDPTSEASVKKAALDWVNDPSTRKKQSAADIERLMTGLGLALDATTGKWKLTS
jgi:hypothetical protein